MKEVQRGTQGREDAGYEVVVGGAETWKGYLLARGEGRGGSEGGRVVAIEYFSTLFPYCYHKCTNRFS